MSLALKSIRLAISRAQSCHIHRDIRTVSRQALSSASLRTGFDCEQSKIHHNATVAQQVHALGSNSIKTFSTHDASNNSFRGYDLSSPKCNVPTSIAERIGTNLHLQPKHPLNTIKNIIEDYWQKRNGFVTRDDLDPIVPTINNFDSLLIQPDHVSRSKSDTYYLDGDTVLRTHTSAHQTTLLNAGEDRFLVTGDVYR